MPNVFCVDSVSTTQRLYIAFTRLLSILCQQQ